MNLANLLRHISLKHVKLQRTYMLLAVSGICLGVAAMVSIDIVNKSVLQSFAESIDHITGRAALEITGAESGFPEELLERVQNVPGVEYAVPVIEASANLSGGSERAFMILGVDVLQDYKIRSYSLNDETTDIPDPLLFLAKKDSILLSQTMAKQEGIVIDQEIEVQTVQGIKKFKVRGLLNPKGPAKVAGGDIAIMDIFAAQAAFGNAGSIDRIDVSFLPGEKLDTMEARIRKVLPEGYSLDTPTGRTRQVAILLDRFQKSMRFIGFMVMFVGMYLIYNAVSISMVQRRKEIGILRALGAKGGEIIALLFAETCVISAVASVVGIGIGLGFAKLSVGIVAQSITDMYLKTSVTALTFSWTILFRDAAFGILASLIAAAYPAVSGVRSSPISMILPLAPTVNGFKLSRKLMAVSVLLLFLSSVILAAYGMAASDSAIRTTGAIFASALLLIIGISLLTPAFFYRSLLIFRHFLAPWLGAGGRLACINLQKNVSRNGVAVAAIFFSIALYVCSANAMHSLRVSMFDWIDSIIRADILISSGNPLVVGGAQSIPMPESLAKEIEKIPGLQSVEPFRKSSLDYGGRKIMLEIFDVALRMDYCPGMFAEGSKEEVVQLVPGQDNIMVNEGFAARYHIKRGDTLVLPTPDGPVRFGVAAIVVSYTSDSGIIWMDINTYRRLWRDTLVDCYEVRVKEKKDIPAVRQAILDRLGKNRHLFALPALEFRNEIKKIMESSFLITHAVNIIVLIIAGFGIVITQLASVLERTREIGVLRAIGMKKNQVAGVVIIESALIGTVGGFLGAAAGLLLGWIELEGFFRLDYGASIAYHIHYASVAWAIVLSAGLAALAGFYPARRAARINIVEALTNE
ncbi:MAG: FtsX-like permease family protein [Desulfocapsaceae bacterium]|nr:FtsX-like permease family protein [Desulfocapsaceae bacterium]